MLFKVVSLAIALIAVTEARPGYLHGHPHHLEYPLVHHEPLHVAKIVHVPAAISHQSSTVIHSAPHHIVKPIVVPVPVVKTVVQPVIKAYHPAPIIKSYHPAPIHLEPFPHHYDHHGFHHFP